MQRREKENPKKALTPRDIAKECGWGVTNTYRMLAEGTIPSIRVGNRYFVPRAAFERWLASCGGRIDGGAVA